MFGVTTDTILWHARRRGHPAQYARGRNRVYVSPKLADEIARVLTLSPRVDEPPKGWLTVGEVRERYGRKIYPPRMRHVRSVRFFL